VNYIYGTWSVLCALNAAGLPADDPMVARAVGWLKAIQNPDGGWGEDCDSYALDRKGHVPAPSTASQTAWALLGLMAAGEADLDAVERGVDWLVANQEADGLGAGIYTGGGFRACSTCAITDIRSISRCGPWRAIATSSGRTRGRWRSGCDRPVASVTAGCAV
jgi:squalene cyclase